MLLHQERQRIKEWCMQYSIRLQEKCYIQLMDLVGDISKAKCFR